MLTVGKIRTNIEWDWQPDTSLRAGFTKRSLGTTIYSHKYGNSSALSCIYSEFECAHSDLSPRFSQVRRNSSRSPLAIRHQFRIPDFRVLR